MTELAKQSNTDLDKFYTPAWPVRLLCDQWGKIKPSRACTVAEPCAGNGAICDVVGEYGCTVCAGDVQPDADLQERWPDQMYGKSRLRTIDARHPDAGSRHVYGDSDVVVTNPPYSADAGTAGDVLKAVVSWGLPTAALLRVTWLEPCADRVWAWLADHDSHRKPTAVWMLPRVEYEYPDKDKPGNPATSMWVLWEPSLKDREVPWPSVGGTVLKVFGPEARDYYMGQTSLLEVAE